MAIATRERPILFSGPMVRALLAGTKTQTRRIVKPQPEVMYEYPNEPELLEFLNPVTSGTYKRESFARLCKYGQVGDVLWVRETWAPAKQSQLVAINDATYACFPDGSQMFRSNGEYYQQDTPVSNTWPTGWKWRPSIHMPRWASRITLEITEVRVERLQDISVEDVFAEGISDPDGRLGWAPSAAIAEYAKLWDSINGDGAWDKNCWVWCLSFKRLA